MHHDENIIDMNDEQALLAKVIEESLQNAHHNPSANYNEDEEELQKILEMSKNIK
jgi:hypothetical protein